MEIYATLFLSLFPVQGENNLVPFFASDEFCHRNMWNIKKPARSLILIGKHTKQKTQAFKSSTQ